MHPSALANSVDKPRRVARKRERRASCSAASPSVEISYPIPSLQTKMERRNSGSAGSPRSHSKMERRSSFSAGLPRPDRKMERRSSGSARSTRSHPNVERRSSFSTSSPRSHQKMERRSSLSTSSPRSHQKMERRGSGSALSSKNGFSVSHPKMERRFSGSSRPVTERRLSASSHQRVERRMSGSSASLPFGASWNSKMTRRSSCGPAPYNPTPAQSFSCHTRMERRSSCDSTVSLSDSFNSVSSVRSCSFREEPEIRHVQSATSMIDNPSDLWFQKEDFENFREKTRRILSNVDSNGRGKNGKKYCTRGLEKYMAATSIKRNHIRRNILLALEHGDSSSLEDYSESCVSEARRLAATDAKAASNICKRMYPHRRNSIQ